MNGHARPAIGTVLDEKYTLMRQIGRGGMGGVFEAQHLRLGQRVAIKFMRVEYVADPEALARFEREARAAARLTSPHVARIFDVGATESGIPYIVMELLEGHDLGDELTRNGGTLPIPVVVDWLLQACAGLAEAHAAGIVHRDLKPSNLFACDSFSGEPMVKLLDFGVSKFVEDGKMELTSSAMMLGTPHYMSPEQVTVSKTVDARSDVWALSVIMYRALSGAFPYAAPSVTQLAVAIATTPPRSIFETLPALPPALGAVIHRGLVHDPAQRIADVYAFAAAVAPFGSGRWRVPAAPSSRASLSSSPALASSGSLPAPAPSEQSHTATLLDPIDVEVSMRTLGATARDAAAAGGASKQTRRSWFVPLIVAGLAVGATAGGLITLRVARARQATKTAAEVVRAASSTAPPTTSSTPTPPSAPSSAPLPVSTLAPSASAVTPTAAAPPTVSASQKRRPIVPQPAPAPAPAPAPRSSADPIHL